MMRHMLYLLTLSAIIFFLLEGGRQLQTHHYRYESLAIIGDPDSRHHHREGEHQG